MCVDYLKGLRLPNDTCNGEEADVFASSVDTNTSRNYDRLIDGPRIINVILALKDEYLSRYSSLTRVEMDMKSQERKDYNFWTKVLSISLYILLECCYINNYIHTYIHTYIRSFIHTYIYAR